MEPATAEPNKRHRSDTAVRTPDDDAPTPLKAGKNLLASHCASLQPQIANILSRLGQQHLLLLHKIFTKKKQAKKLESDVDLIPRSARVKFTLTASKLVESDAEFLRLKEETQVLIESFQKDLKRKIISSTSLEARLTLTQLRLDFATALSVATKAFVICEPALDVDNLHKIVHTILSRAHASLLKHLDTSLDDFVKIYKQQHTITDLPAPYANTINETDPATNVPNSNVCNSITKIARTLSDVFCSPWDKFLQANKRTEMDLELKKLSVSHFDTAATDATQMIIDSEPPADPPQLQALVQQQVTKQTKSLQQELRRLKQQLASSKNEQRGRSKSAPRQKTRTQSTNTKPQGAAANNNASADANKSSTKRNSTTKSRNGSNKRNTNSKHKKRTQSRQSATNSS